jgi:hypothetical protein
LHSQVVTQLLITARETYPTTCDEMQKMAESLVGLVLIKDGAHHAVGHNSQGLGPTRRAIMAPDEPEQNGHGHADAGDISTDEEEEEEEEEEEDDEIYKPTFVHNTMVFLLKIAHPYIHWLLLCLPAVLRTIEPYKRMVSIL